MMVSLLISTAYLAASAPAAPVPHWTGFRGDGSSSTQSATLPTKWSPDTNIMWRTPLPGYGQSGPVVWDHRIFVTAIDGEQKEKLYVVAIDGRFGKQLWKHESAATLKGKNTPMMSRAAPTPVVDANRLYAFFESGDFLALSHTGEVIWTRSLCKEYAEFKNNHGLGSSLAQTDAAVIVLIDDTSGSYLLAIDKKTGKNLWKTDRENRGSWTSPLVASLLGKTCIVTSSSGTVVVYDAGTGKELAKREGIVGNNIASPITIGDLIVIGAGENRMKPDLAASTKSNCALKLIEKDGKFELDVVWQAKKALSHHASPVHCAGYVYFVTKTGIVHCLDAKTGEEKYAERLDNQTWATPIATDRSVYFFGKDGVTTILKSGPEYEVIASNRHWSAEDFAKRKEEAKKQAEAKQPPRPEGKEPSRTPPLPKEELDAVRNSAVGDVVYGAAPVGRAIFVRTGTELIGIQEK
jgi:outer membrane protein assembly factor BamB